MNKTDLILPLNHQATDWQALAYFNLYRILLSGMFVLLLHIGQLPQPLGSLNPKIFLMISQWYLLIALLLSIFIHYQYPKFNIQVAFHSLFDIIMLSILMYSSNGLSSGFGMLLIIAVAGGSILRAGKIAILFAAIATIMVIGHELYIQFFIFSDTVNYTHAGILGGTFFITAIISRLLSAKVRATETLARQQAIEIYELANLNENIVQRLQTGIVVMDHQLHVLLLNESAKHLLQYTATDPINKTEHLQQWLEKPINEWLSGNGQTSIIIKSNQNAMELQASFIKLEKTNTLKFQILVFIEDIIEIKKQAQRLKLASLGRLTASIAHEIRNPLGAISHAGQLLLESDVLVNDEKRLSQIINEQSMRINNIIENVMSISRRQATIPEQFLIIPWLEKFRDELIARYSLEKDAIEIVELQKDIEVKIDPSQLHQALWNLAENGLRYSTQYPYLSFQCGIETHAQRVFIDVVDYGSGIDDEIKQNLFEPFFTTESQGSGLGLYLCKELCEANQATLSCHSTSNQGTIFRIMFLPINKKIT